MLLEKNLRDKDLSVFKIEPMRNLAKQIIQYSKFKTCVALEKMNHASFTRSTAQQYFEAGRKYLTTKTRTKKGSVALYDNLDFWIDRKLQPLTPSQEDKNNRPITSNEQPKIEIKIEPVRLTCNFEYAVRYNNNIKIFNTEEECKAFIEAGKTFTSNIDFKIVTVVIEDLKND